MDGFRAALTCDHNDAIIRFTVDMRVGRMEAQTMTMFAKFAGRCILCKGQINAGQSIDWTKGVGARHLSVADCVVAKPIETVKAGFDGKGIADFILAAKARGLKYPKVRFLHAGEELRISVAGERSKAPGSLDVKIAGEWIGRVRPDGSISGALQHRADVQTTLARIASDPVTCAKEYGALTCCCSFCGLKLSDEGSVEVGYGPTCAKHYGLPHHPKGSPEVFSVPSTSDIARDARRAADVDAYQGLRGRML